MPAPRLHGLKPPIVGQNGEFFFATINLFKALKNALTFPGINKYPNLASKDGKEAWPQKDAARFIMAVGKLEDTFWKIERLAELLDDARRNFMDFEAGTISSEDIARFQRANRDFPLYLDAILIFVRIFVDLLAALTSHLYRGENLSSRSFRDQKKWFAKSPETDLGYASILANQTAWFTTLAGVHHGQGLRDLVVHKSVRAQLFIRPGPTPDQNRVHAFLYGDSHIKGVDLVPTIQQMVGDFFLFLDSYAEHFVTRIEHILGVVLPEYHSPRFPLLFEFEGPLPSAWLFPRIEASEPETVSIQRKI